MTAPTFLQTLKYEVGRMQAAHPEREGEIARASALISLGMVTPSADDPATGQVLSSDMTRTYHVNGACDCSAGQHGKDCKHQHAWKLYRHVEKKVASRMPKDATFPPRETPDTSQAPGLGEAPASLNLKVLIQGHEVQVTLRGTDEAQLLTRLQTLLKRSDIRPIPKPAPRQSGGWKQRNNQGR